MKICMVAGIFPPQIGGPATQAWHLCETLQSNGVETLVVTFGEATRQEEYQGIPVHRFRLSYPFGVLGKVVRLTRFAVGLFSILRRERPDVVHCHDAHFHSLVAGAISKLLRIPSVVKFAGDLVYEKVNDRGLRAASLASAYRAGLSSRVLALVERRGLELFDVVWAASQFRRTNLVESLHITPEKLRVIPNYIKLPGLSSMNDADLKPSSGPPYYVLSAGRFTAHKRVDRTLQAIAVLGRSDVKLRLVGGGDTVEEAEVARYIAELGISEQIERCGTVSYPELIRLMATSHVLLSTSEEEGFGIVFVEAMSVGLPVVAMRIGAVPEVVTEGETGFLLEPGDVAGIADRLRLLIDSPELRQEMGDRGRQHAQRYNLERHWVTFAELYEQLARRQLQPSEG